MTWNDAFLELKSGYVATARFYPDCKFPSMTRCRGEDFGLEFNPLVKFISCPHLAEVKESHPVDPGMSARLAEK